MKSLQQIWSELNAQGKGSDKNTDHSYVPYYETIFEPYRHTAANILEIGIFKGHSLLMWEEYFNGRVYGIDCTDQPVGGMADLRPMIESGQHNIEIMDACDETEVAKRFGDLRFDVIIDDAQHEINQQLDLYNLWKHYLTPNSVYIIEDVQNIDADREKFLSLDPEKSIEVVDRRAYKGRYDDILIVIKPK